MAKRRREKMSEGKKNIIAGLIQEYDIKTAAEPSQQKWTHKSCKKRNES